MFFDRNNSKKDSGGGLLPPIKPHSTMQRSERPGDRLTIEERRLDLAVRVGPYRVFAGESRRVDMLEGAPVAISLAKGQNKLPSFVRVELVDGFQPFDLDLSINLQSSAVLTGVFSNYVEVVLLAHEILFATAYNVPEANNITAIKVTEVII